MKKIIKTKPAEQVEETVAFTKLLYRGNAPAAVVVVYEDGNRVQRSERYGADDPDAAALFAAVEGPLSTFVDAKNK